MTRSLTVTALSILALGACAPISGGSVSVGGEAAVGLSSSSSVQFDGRGGAIGGPPPGRTASERSARKAYFRGPRGRGF